MKKLLFGLLVLALPARAQPALRYQSQKGLMDATPYVAYLADTTRSLTVEQVRQLPRTAFRANTKTGLSLGNVSAPYWFRIDFTDTFQAEDLYLYSDFPLQYLDIWRIDRNERVRSWQTGVRRPFGGRDLLTNKYIVNLGRQPKQVFFRIQSPTIYLPIAISRLGPLTAFTHPVDLFMGGLVGLVVTLACYNLLLFFSLGDRTFLYYAGYGLTMGYLILRSIGSWQMFVSPEGGWINADNNTGYILAVLFGYLFATKFLSLKALAPTLYRICTAMMVVLLGLMVAEWILPYHAWQNDLVDGLVIGGATVVIVSGVYTWALGYEPARYFTLAWLPLTVTIVILFLSLLNVLPMSVFWANSATLIGIALEAVLMSLAVANRFNLFRKEARQAQTLVLQRAQENGKLLAAHNRILEEKRQIEQRMAHPMESPPPAIEELLTKLRQERGRGRKLPVSTAEGVLLLPVADIVRIEALGSYCTIFLTNHKKVTASKPLAEFEPLLDKDEFLRVHKSHLININFVERYVRGEGGTVTMPDGAEVSVSRLMKSELLNRLNIA